MTILAQLAPAKINLTLSVLQQRDDGYHSLKSLVAFADFGNIVLLRTNKRDHLQCSGKFAAELPASVRSAVNANLASRAILALRRAGAIIPNLQCCLNKMVPAGAGLGSGSSDAAAVLRLLQFASDQAKSLRHNNYPDPTTRSSQKINQIHLINQINRIQGVTSSLAIKIANTLGSDIHACLVCAPLLLCGRGETVTKLAKFPGCGISVLIPPFRLSTRAVYAALVQRTRRSEPTHVDSATRINSYQELIALLDKTTNDLLFPATTIYPDLERLLTELGKTRLFDFVGMSGSGSALFGLTAEPLAWQKQQQLVSATSSGAFRDCQFIFGRLFGSSEQQFHQQPLVA